MNAFKETSVGCLLAGSFVGFFASLIFGFMFAGGGMYRTMYTRNPTNDAVTDTGTLVLGVAAMGMTVICFVLFVGTLLYGIFSQKKSATGVRQTIEYARIIARYGFNREGVMLTEEWHFEDADRPKFYVRMQTPTGGSDEYETSEETFWQCGEGMVGEAEVQGKWLGKFIPYIGAAPGP